MKETPDKLPKTLSDINRKGGETVPEGYFDSFKAMMEQSLPERRWEYDGEAAEGGKRSLWLKIKPYAYLAAMFLGIWCMMYMFDLIRAGSAESFDQNPAMIAAINNDTFFDEYVVPDADSYEVMDYLYETGFDPASLEDETQPEYEL